VAGTEKEEQAAVRAWAVVSEPSGSVCWLPSKRRLRRVAVWAGREACVSGLTCRMVSLMWAVGVG